MKIPSREECEKLLKKYNFPARKRKHLRIVTKTAIFLGKKLRDKKIKVNLDLIYAGAMLHDIDKGIEKAGENHPLIGVQILAREGYREISKICKTHTINSFLNPKTRPISWEEKCVALADKMAKEEVIGLEERFAYWRKECKLKLAKSRKEKNIKLIKDWNKQIKIVEKSYFPIRKLEREICDLMGIRPEKIKNYLEKKGEDA